MVRTYKPKTDRKNINEENIKDAIREVLSKTLSIRKAADKYGIKTATLQHRIEKARTLSKNEPSSSLQAESSLSQAGPSSPQKAQSHLHCTLLLQLYYHTLLQLLHQTSMVPSIPLHKFFQPNKKRH